MDIFTYLGKIPNKNGGVGVTESPELDIQARTGKALYAFVTLKKHQSETKLQHFELIVMRVLYDT